ncbi:hypothetical protein F5Y08DRAFT_4104 [Xylaria arbuscula]|nr:hypothetical protein F5Y08DRAFT_4104 [Xylaria arbuscula]
MMDKSTLSHRRGTSPLSERKRSHEPHDADAPSGRRRRTDEHGDMHRRRSRSPRPSHRSGHRDRTQPGHVSHARHRRRGSNARDDPYDAEHRNNTTHQTGSQSRSPTRHHDSHRHRSHHAPKTSGLNQDRELPCNARALSRSADFNAFRPLFARYLDVQKQIEIAALDEREVRGRWKSFVNKWNHGDLAEGWYRPETFEDVMLDAQGRSNLPESEGRQERERDSSARQETDLRQQNRGQDGEEDNDDEEDDDDYGPILPTQDNIDSRTRSDQSLSQTKHGPGIPTLSDITLRREYEASDGDDARTLLRLERKADRTLQKERLDELAPRADAGTQARRLEKRREARDSNASFANAKSSNEMPDLADADLMGGDGDGGGGIEEYKRMKRETERRKSEREIRREEIWRAKQEEREERLKEYREREARTLDRLREVARARFG